MIFTNPCARIIVAYDGSAPSEIALDEALVLARQYGGELVVVHVSDLAAPATFELETAVNPAPGDSGPLLASLDLHRQDLFRKLSVRVVACSVPVRLEFSMNTAATGILDAAARWRATMIAIGTHARKGLEHAFLGSVAEVIVHRALVPVIVLREGSLTTPLHRIVVGVDISEPSADASAFALSLAREHPVRPVFCTVIDTASMLRPEADLAFDPMPVMARMRADARVALDLAVQHASAADNHPDIEIASATDVASGMIDVAHHYGADAIVVGTHRRSSLQRFFIGSTAQDILQNSDVPVIVVPVDRSTPLRSRERSTVAV